MATEIVQFNPAQVPAFAKKAELTALAKALAGGGGGQTGKRISIRGGVFRLYSDGKEVASIDDRHLDVVVVNAAAKITRTYYAAAFDENNPAAPDCWSPDGEKPDSSSKNKQSANCASCPQNVKGSGQGDARACRFSQRLAVVLANDMEGDVLQLSLPATSIFGRAEGENRPLQAHARWLAEQGIDPGALVTRLKFDTSVANPKLFFKPVRWLTDAEYTVCQQQGKTDDAVKAVTMSVSQVDGVKDGAPANLAGSAPTGMKTAKTVKQEPEEAAAPQEEEQVEPTIKKAAAKAPAPARTGTKISQVLQEWDDE